jgi:hypothetical protein
MRPTTQKKPSLNSFLTATGHGQARSAAATPPPSLLRTAAAPKQSLNSVLSSREDVPLSLNSGVLSSSRRAPSLSDVVPPHIEYMRNQVQNETPPTPTLMSSLSSPQPQRPSLLSPQPQRQVREMSPIESLMADIDGVANVKAMLERPPTAPLTFVNILPSTDVVNNYVESVLQFIFTNKTWSQFFTVKTDQIAPLSALIFIENGAQNAQNGLTQMQIHLFILIIKYIFTLYSSSTTITPNTDANCVITWIPLAVDAYRILRRHLMILISSRGISAKNFQDLLSTILDCMPGQVKTSLSVGGNRTKFIRLPAPLSRAESLQNFLTTSGVDTGGAVIGEKYFIVFYNDAQTTPDIDITQGFGALDDYILDYVPPISTSRLPQFLRSPPPPPPPGVSHCPGTVTLRNGEIYRKLVQIHTGQDDGDTKYSAEIASPSSENGEVMFVTNETAVVTRQNQLKGECQPVLRDIFVTQRPLTRLVVMYQKTIVKPPTNPERAMGFLQPIAQYVTPVRAAAVGAAAYGANLFQRGWDSIRFDHVN